MASTSAELKIGFADPAEKSWLLESRFAAAKFAADGKIGGRPSWLSLSGLPPPSAMACAHCSAPMVFLLQLYAPYHWPGLEAAFHRTIFLFMCKRAECHAEDKAAPFAVFRSQLGRSVVRRTNFTYQKSKLT